MLEFSYCEALNQMKNPYNIRLRLVKHAQRHGISSAARRFDTTRKTVRKWFGRFGLEGLDGLQDRSRRPKHSPNKLSEAIEQEIIAIRKRLPYLGAYRIRYEHGIKASEGAIHRVLRDAGLVRKRRKKHHKQQDLREYKKRFAPFEKIQVDLKELKDIVHYYPYLHDNYPKYQFSARDMRTGVTFVSYGYEKSTINVGFFVLYVCQHLANMGVDLSKVEWQSDNGAEFVGPTNRKRGQTFYEDIVDQFGCKRSRIPPRQCTYNSDVEAMHRLIEDEFYDLEDYDSQKQFLCKAFTYMLYFNYRRRFRYKYGKTPMEILKENTTNNRKARRIAILRPIILDHYAGLLAQKGGYHVPKAVKPPISNP